VVNILIGHQAFCITQKKIYYIFFYQHRQSAQSLDFNYISQIDDLFRNQNPLKTPL